MQLVHDNCGIALVCQEDDNVLVLPQALDFHCRVQLTVEVSGRRFCFAELALQRAEFTPSLNFYR